MQFVLYSSLNLSRIMYYEQKNSILDVPENSKETTVTLVSNLQSPASLLYLHCISTNLYVSPISSLPSVSPLYLY